ncbi:MAG: hypothetical protein JWO23_2839 [Solirubrobacterales bacterium]|jgi:hypothetical protein|nr:hypothetical protein [Solirubrobacterales bacterium]
MKRRSFVVACLFAGFALAGCGGSGGTTGTTSSASLRPRLLASSAVPGFGLQRTLDWSDPVDLVGEGLALPQVTHPSAAVKEFKDASFKGAAGEVLTNGTGPNGTEIRLGVAQFANAADATRVRDWMHREDLHQPCFGPCVFAPTPVSLAGLSNVRLVVQSSPPPPLPPGAPRGVRIVRTAPTNYLAEFTVGPYLYWAAFTADSSAKAKFEQGVKLYYAHARQTA